MNRREFLFSTLATFALAALPKLTLAEEAAISEAVRAKINPKNKLGFGFMRLPLKDKKDQTAIDYDELNKMVDLFLERGFTYFDTAWMYMGHESEIALRKSLVERHPRNKFSVASKLPVGMIKSKAEQEQVFNKQLEKTGLEYFDAPQLKVMQEAITIAVFCVFSILYLKEDLKWNYVVGFALILLAVFFVFRKWD